ncbi:MAG: D-Ala-D-Ala carboxypeptidase family metallohydrolase [Wenzhouxiangellaceae bacterium]
MKPILLVLAICLCAGPLTARAAPLSTPFEPGTVDYELSFNDMRINWNAFAFSVMPGQVHDLKVHMNTGQPVEVTASGGELNRVGPTEWNWRAPAQPGPLTIAIRPENADTAMLHVFVKVPVAAVADGYLNGYRLGTYPDSPLRNNPIYLPPPGFIEVHPDMLDLPVSPHFTLGQFLCKQQPDHWPKYLVLRESLIAKLEFILAEVNQHGIRTDSLFVMSGYRTPWYNQTIGNVPYSRHVWGGAADIFIDTTGNGRMDDLNNDDQIDRHDARTLLSIINELYETGRLERLRGGLGLYGPRPHRGPFVHVDTRGQEARWEIP